jgi:hypothetical protein
MNLVWIHQKENIAHKQLALSKVKEWFFQLALIPMVTLSTVSAMDHVDPLYLIALQFRIVLQIDQSSAPLIILAENLWIIALRKLSVHPNTNFVQEKVLAFQF